MEAPPSSDGAVQERLIAVIPLAVAVRPVGAPGTAVTPSLSVMVPVKFRTLGVTCVSGESLVHLIVMVSSDSAAPSSMMVMSKSFVSSPGSTVMNVPVILKPLRMSA